DGRHVARQGEEVRLVVEVVAAEGAGAADQQGVDAEPALAVRCGRRRGAPFAALAQGGVQGRRPPQPAAGVGVHLVRRGLGGGRGGGGNRAVWWPRRGGFRRAGSSFTMTRRGGGPRSGEGGKSGPPSLSRIARRPRPL